MPRLSKVNLLFLIGLGVCQVSLNGIPPMPEVIELADGTYKVFVAHPSKTQVVKTSKGFMNKICSDKGLSYDIISENIEMTGEAIDQTKKSSSVSVLGVSRTESEYETKHMQEGEVHFKCVPEDEAASSLVHRTTP